LISISTTILVESLIAENQVRSSSMETTKDEAQQIMYKLNKKLAKERQAKITGELIELITSFTSLNDSN
jgi:F0F1-type ATP synthase gamma subunit